MNNKKKKPQCRCVLCKGPDTGAYMIGRGTWRSCWLSYRWRGLSFPLKGGSKGGFWLQKTLQLKRKPKEALRAAETWWQLRTGGG